MSDVVTIEDDEESKEKEDKSRRGIKEKSDADTKIELLPYEQSLMIDTFAEDVLFIMARGLGLEQLVLNHLHLYSDRRFTVLVINTTQEDEHYFLDSLKLLNKDCPPKHITADVLSKDRELIYKVGGVQFVTSRILMVDLLTNRVPIDKVAGIVVYRAHEILAGYQESFILRLFREKKKNGFVKAFTDDPARIFFAGLGQLQRLMDKLYVKRVVVVPRFDASPKFTQVSVDLPQNQKKIRNLLADIINTCIRELKQCTHGLDVNTATDKMASSAALSQTELEADLRKKTLLLSERQERILTDLRILRKLLHKVEDLDPTKACVESLVFVKNSKGYRTITAPPKWSGLNSVLKELAVKIMRSRDEAASESPVLVLVSNEQTCRQLIDLVKFGEEKFCWMLTKGSYDGSRSGDFGPEPETHPIWNPVNVCFYDDQLTENVCSFRNIFINFEVFPGSSRTAQ
ncbi:DNA repair endonuclease XPF [Ditylenchus destructor]|nr:DNA repair endonuclease XPF [Ditylenchus destructor]